MIAWIVDQIHENPQAQGARQCRSRSCWYVRNLLLVVFTLNRTEELEEDHNEVEIIYHVVYR